MALTNRQVAAVNQVINHLTGHPAITRERAIDALVTLADGAYRATYAGWIPDQARGALTDEWPDPADTIDVLRALIDEQGCRVDPQNGACWAHPADDPECALTEARRLITAHDARGRR